MGGIVASIRLEVVAEYCRAEAGGAIIVGERDVLVSVRICVGDLDEALRLERAVKSRPEIADRSDRARLVGL